MVTVVYAKQDAYCEVERVMGRPGGGDSMQLQTRMRMRSFQSVGDAALGRRPFARCGGGEGGLGGRRMGRVSLWPSTLALLARNQTCVAALGPENRDQGRARSNRAPDGGFQSVLHANPRHEWALAGTLALQCVQSSRCATLAMQQERESLITYPGWGWRLDLVYQSAATERVHASQRWAVLHKTCFCSAWPT
jgi:hypothetical protein